MQYYKLLIISSLFVLAGCSTAKSFEFKEVKSVRIEKASFKKNIINAQVAYFNPNNFDVSLKKIDCDILINDKKITHYSLDTNLIIKSNSNFNVPARMEFELSNILPYTVDIMFKKPIKITILGNATLSKGIFTKTVPINYTTVKTLDLKESMVREVLKSIQKL
jgi:LEA14-like dessication related protein